MKSSLKPDSGRFDTKFLFRGGQYEIVTSDAGMYGECNASTLRGLFNVLKELTGFDKDSVFVDIGAGRGVPSIVAASHIGPLASLGVEMDPFPTSLGFQNILKIANMMKDNVSTNVTKTEFATPVRSRKTINNYSTETPSLFAGDRLVLENSPRLAFLVQDCTMFSTFDPCTHVYSFDAAMPQFVIAKIIECFEMSETAYCFVSFRSDLRTLGLKADLIGKFSMRMQGSGEGRQCCIFLKKNWNEIRKRNIQERVENAREFRIGHSGTVETRWHIPDAAEEQRINLSEAFKNWREEPQTNFFKLAALACCPVDILKEENRNAYNTWQSTNYRSGRRNPDLQTVKAMELSHEDSMREWLNEVLEKNAPFAKGASEEKRLAPNLSDAKYIKNLLSLEKTPLDTIPQTKEIENDDVEDKEEKAVLILPVIEPLFLQEDQTQIKEKEQSSDDVKEELTVSSVPLSTSEPPVVQEDKVKGKKKVAVPKAPMKKGTRLQKI